MDPIIKEDEEETSLFTIPEGSFTLVDDEEEAPQKEVEDTTLYTLPEGAFKEVDVPEDMEVIEKEEGLYTVPEGSFKVIDGEPTELTADPAQEESTYSAVKGAVTSGVMGLISGAGDASPIFKPFSALADKYTEAQDEKASQELGIIEEAGQTFSREDVISNPDKMGIIRDYMTLRSGVQYEDRSDEEVYDDYLTTMRYVASNDLSLIQDVRLLGQISEEDKPKLGKAYLLFQNIEGPDSLGAFGDAIKDYGVGAATSISTWAGLGIGKMYGRVGSKAAARVAITTAKEAAIQQAIKAGAKRSVAKAAGAAAAKAAAASAAKYAAGKTAVATLAVDTVTSVAADALYQDHMINTGAQDEYSFIQGSIAAASAVIPAGIGGALSYKTWKSGAPALGAVIEAGNSATKAARRAKLTPNAINAAFKTFSDNVIDWQKAVARGERINLDSRAAQTRIYEELVGSPSKGLGLLPNLMKSAGVVFSKENPAIQEMISFYRGLDTQTRWNINVQMKQHLGMSMGQLTDVLAKSVNTSASQIGYLGEVARDVQQIAVASKAANKLTSNVGGEGIGDVTLRGVQYFQSVLRRSFVAHPYTSAVNVMGWGTVRAAESLSFLLSGVSHGTMGLAGMVASPFSASAKTFSNLELKKSVATFKAVGYNLQNLLDPYTTKETFDQLLPYLDKTTRETITSTGFSGVERTASGVGKTIKGQKPIKPDTIYGFDPNNKFIKGVEGYLDKAARGTLVKAQDSYTKSVSLLSNLDYQLRLHGDKGLMQVLKEGGVEAIPAEVMDKATKRTMRDVMSMDYTKGKNFMHKMAGFVEGLSNAPGLGMVFPFGRFLNNSLAFSFRYSPIGAIRVFSSDTIDDIPTILAQSAVGSTFAYMMYKHEEEKYKQGIPWYAEEGADGTQYDLTNLAPSSAYNLMGRIWFHHVNKDTDIDGDTVKELFTQLGSLGLVYTADRNTELLTKSFQDFTNKLAEASEEEKAGYSEILTGIMLAGDSVLAGFTRPLEVPNILLGVGGNTDQISDRSMYEGTDLFVSEATRYTDQLFAMLNPSEPGVGQGELGPRKVSATNPKAGREYNPYSRLVGMKLRQPQTTVEKMFAQADFPEWRGNIKSDIPELDRVINERVFSILEKRAKETISSPRWKNASLRERRDFLRDILRNSQREVRDWIEENPGSFEYTLKARRDLTTQSERLRKQAKEALDISDVPDRELSLKQIEQIKALIDLYKDDEKLFTE